MQANEIQGYQHQWVVDIVYKASRTIEHQVTNVAIVERRTFNKIGRYISATPRNIKNRRYIERMIYREMGEALKNNRNKREHATHLADITHDDGEGQAIEYEPEDVLADINSEALELKETITLLAKDDRRNKLILNAWANGYTEAKEISCILADTLGGNPESHRKHIQRFKKSCRTELTAQAI